MLFKWVGSKDRLVDDIIAYMPKRIDNYYEPFLGAGHVALELLKRKRINHGAFLSDRNVDLMAFWMALKESPKELWAMLVDLNGRRTKADYLRIREWRSDDVIKRAGRFYYLIKQGYRGLWRVNGEGRFNVAYAGDSSPVEFLPDEKEFSMVHDLLDSPIVHLDIIDFRDALKIQNVNFTTIYLDPPYFNTFNAYTNEKFGRHEHVVLKDRFETLKGRGARIIESNSDNQFIRDLYRKHTINTVSLYHNTTSTGGSEEVQEVVIT